MEVGQKFYTVYVGGNTDGGLHWITEHQAIGEVQGLVIHETSPGRPTATRSEEVFTTREDAVRSCIEQLKRLRDKSAEAYNKRIVELESKL